MVSRLDVACSDISPRYVCGALPENTIRWSVDFPVGTYVGSTSRPSLRPVPATGPISGALGPMGCLVRFPHTYCGRGSVPKS